MRPATSIVVSLVRQSRISKPIGLGLLQFKKKMDRLHCCKSEGLKYNDVTLSLYQWSSFLCEWFWNPATGSGNHFLPPWNQWKTSTDCGTKKPVSVRTALSLVPIPMLHVHHRRLQPATMHTDLIQCRSSSKSLKTRLDFILASAEQFFQCIRI